MRRSGLKMTLRPIVRKTGVLPHLRALRGHSIRLARQCGRLRNSHGQSEPAVPSRLYSMSADGLPTWFGYYDKTPFSGDDSRILAMAMTCARDWSDAALRMPVRLGYFEWSQVANGKPVFHPFGRTETWCWQQGCMLQWFGAEADRLVLYNRLVDGRYGCVVQDVFTQDLVASYTMPIYAIDPAGRRGVGLNFSRLERLRPGYGYSNVPDETASEACPANDGLWRIDLTTGETEMLLSLRQIAEPAPQPSMADGPHYINHLLFTPDGRGLVFLHLWLSQSRRMNRLMLYDLDDRSLHVVDDAAIVSHFNWLAGDRLICFRYPHEGTPGYYEYSFGPGRTFACAPMRPGMPSQYGHPSLSPAGDLLITDTYPDRAGEQTLLVYSMRQGILREAGRVYSPFRYRGPQRCDLHPRWDITGHRICFDAIDEGKRCIHITDISGSSIISKAHEGGES